VIPIAVAGLRVPAIPVVSFAVEHDSFRLRIEDCSLQLELFGQPDIISIQDRYELTFGLANADIMRRAYAPIVVARMFDVTNSLYVSIGALPGEVRTAVD